MAVKSPPVPRPPETTTAASVSSGRPLDCFGSLFTIACGLRGVGNGHLDLLNGGSVGAARGSRRLA